jgi:radical SAM protein with 4Fe4S-binding SPASM domain
LGLHILEVEITTRCNLNCQICYNRGHGIIDLPFSSIIRLVSFAKRYKIFRLVISGGEACLHPEFNRLARYFLRYQPEVKPVIQSNGLIGRYSPELLRGFGLVHLSIEPEETGVRETLPNQIVTTALRLKNAGIGAYLFATVHPGNLDKIDWLVDLANTNQLDIGFNLCVPVQHRNQLMLSNEQREWAIRKLFGLAQEGKILRFTSPFAAMLDQKHSDRYLGNRGGCTAGIAACSILPDGDVVPCPFFRLSVGNIFQKSLRQIWLGSDILAQIRARNQYDQPCGNCPYLSYCGGCRARAYSKTKSLYGADPDCLPQLAT